MACNTPDQEKYPRRARSGDRAQASGTHGVRNRPVPPGQTGYPDRVGRHPMPPEERIETFFAAAAAAAASRRHPMPPEERIETETAQSRSLPASTSSASNAARRANRNYVEICFRLLLVQVGIQCRPKSE